MSTIFEPTTVKWLKKINLAKKLCNDFQKTKPKIINGIYNQTKKVNKQMQKIKKLN